ncbi:type II toxin-antitoxin system VapC family toxin [Comamonas sp. NLF-1-9]|uniref:type II toxin-antitoxin system VapC family toxin n=1 Tax=Comamonas sp. NLF-1-9 TaxID=2853163 RepID=UPI001C45CCE8|nr:type II toxin-antitoxin system VapC family toxin [Comamonas sp. NLF-1-9]QXL85726.1 type II toxin-antitoxin system VapC family toxin [Comamonas sp. NLF-1-9]
MVWLLDTCVVSESFKSLPEPVVRQWLDAHRGQCLIPAVSVGEILFGIERMVPSARRSRLQLWFEQLCHDFEGKILPTDEAVWRTWSRLRVSCQAIGRPQADLDLLIAATAVTHRLPLVTRNTRHFQDTGLTLVNPWDA